MSLNQQHIFRHRWVFFSPDTAVFCIVMCHVVMCALWNADGNMSFVFVLWQCESTFAPWLWKQWCWMMCAWGVTLCPVQQCRLIAWVCGLGNVILFLCYSGGTTHSPSLPWLWYIGVALCLAGSHLICFLSGSICTAVCPLHRDFDMEAQSTFDLWEPPCDLHPIRHQWFCCTNLLWGVIEYFGYQWSCIVSSDLLHTHAPFEHKIRLLPF